MIPIFLPIFQVSDEETEDSSVLSEGTDEEGHHHIPAPVMSPLSPVYPTADPSSWKRAGNSALRFFLFSSISYIVVM